jgi:hypothetical protein
MGGGWKQGLMMAVLAAGLAVPARAEQVEARLVPILKELGYEDGKLPELKPPFGNYVDAMIVGKMLHLSSAGPQTPKGEFIKGRVPDAVTLDQAIVAAKLSCVRQLARVKQAVGDLDKVARVVFVRGKVFAQDGFADHGKVVDACSGLMVQAFGDAGKHTRTSEGYTSMPFNLTTEFETLFELK